MGDVERAERYDATSEESEEPCFTLQFLQKCIAEVLGTYFLMFTGCSAIVINLHKNNVITHPGVAITWGLIVMVMVYSVGHISGAHFNPAVTIAFLSIGRFPLRHVIPYVVSQILGATCASATVRLLFGNNVLEFPGTVPNGSHIQSLVLEFLVTFLLMFVISGVATDSRAVGELAGIAVGATILLDVLFAGQISGASMNPARSLGPAFIYGRYTGLWLYIVGPIFGAIAGAWAYNTIRFTDKSVRELTKSGSFLRSVSRNK